jgi:hypothetical protein
MPKYPLEPLAELREKKADEAKRRLAEAVRKREAAARTLRAAEMRREAQARAVLAVRKAELEALARGELRAQDLARADAWAIRAAAERKVLGGAVDRAASAEAKARDDERAAQGAMATQRAEVRVVTLHRARWDDQRLRGLEAREEEAASEAWRPKR